MGMTELASRRATDPKQKDQLAKVMQSSQRLQVVINDVLDIANIEAARITLDAVDFELGGVLETSRNLTARSAAEKGLTLVIDAAPELVRRRLHGDPQRLGQILLHLIGNAIKFTADGSITVNLAVTEEDVTEVLLRAEVKDTGIGISANDQTRLFTPFEQADGSMTRHYGGAGLGLALCKRLAEAMGGRIGVKSRPGEGSVFWFTVRLGRGTEVLDDAIAPSTLGAEAELQARFAGTRVLVVQDVPISRDVSRDLLEDAGLRVDLAEDGAVAVEMARQTDYALILMDIQMPRMNGIEATLAIHALPGRAQTPILAVTASVSSADKARCREVGMKDFLAQPTDPEILFATILRWLDRPQTLATERLA